uniref:CCHC-type domain-containing protein n=1 Tax=Knipowitschia caucasica TaxID=637954 RepID=A0AAV2LJR8_KNICA
MRAAGAATYGPQGRGRERRKDSAEIECYRCRKMGHVARNCPSAYEERRRDRRSDAPRRGGQRDSMAAATGEEQQRGATDRWERWARPERSDRDQEGPCPWSAYREAADDGDEDYYEDHRLRPQQQNSRGFCQRSQREKSPLCDFCVQFMMDKRSVVELPALSGKSPEKVLEQCDYCLSLCPEGVHAFIMITPQDGPNDKDKNLNNFKITFIDSIGLDQRSIKKTLRLNTSTQQVQELLKVVDKRRSAYTKDMFVKALIESKFNHSSIENAAEMPSSEGLRIALIGKRGSGKRTTANTILGEKCLVPEAAQPKECEKVSRQVQSRTVTVVNTPPLFEDSFSEELYNCMSQLSPGPHAFLLLLPIRKINEEDRNSLQMIHKSLGEKAIDYVMIVFTGGDELSENYTIENVIEESETETDVTVSWLPLLVAPAHCICSIYRT